ncbi:MAG: DNA cytosine methyltransferase [Promethearchaeati archaeon SRVP18_Atabeyarchaeia-1]
MYSRLSWRRPSPTVVHARRAMLLHPQQHGIISVREAARLQSFPDRFRFMGTLNSQYQQAANAVPPILAKKIANLIKKLLK